MKTGQGPEWIVTAEGAVPFRWRRAGGEVFAEWQGVLTLHVDGEGRVSRRAHSGADPLLVAKLTATGAAAFVRALRGEPSLHGSAVKKGTKALVCLGEKGAGKSTAAWGLCQEDGYELLADDVAALDDSTGRWQVVPTEREHWLALRGARKGPRNAPAAADEPADLFRLVTLRFDTGVSAPLATPLRGAHAYTALAAAFLRFEAVADRRVRELDVLASLATQVGVYDVVRPATGGPDETVRLLMQLMDEAA